MNACMPLVMAQSLALFAPKGSEVHQIVRRSAEQVPVKPYFKGSDADITFKGLGLNVELDCYGNVEGLYSLADGTDCMDIFKDWALTEIGTLAKLAQLETA